MNSTVSVINVLGVVYHHYKSSDGGDLYLTRYAEPYSEHLNAINWYEDEWFTRHRVKLLGTSSVYRVPTKEVDGTSLNLVVKYCRVGEDVPFNTHTLEMYCNAQFNSPWEEFQLVMEILDSPSGNAATSIKTQKPMAIYVPPDKMQIWQSGRSRHRISKIRARHPGIDLDILKQYILVYGWIEGKNLIELFTAIDIPLLEAAEDLKALDSKVIRDMDAQGYYVADMKPEHIIISEEDIAAIRSMGSSSSSPAGQQVARIHECINTNRYSVIDYELLFRTPAHEDKIRNMRRHRYLDDQKNRFTRVQEDSGLFRTEVFGVPYVFGHVESTGGRLWVVGSNARLFDYFLPERWRKTPFRSMSETNEVCYTLTKDNIHIVWRTSRVGELLNSSEALSPENKGINSPFEEAAIAFNLNKAGIPSVYFRAIYMTGTKKLELSQDMRRFESHQNLLDPEGHVILDPNYNYISIRGYYNGTDEWVSEHEDALYTPVDLTRAAHSGIITAAQADEIHAGVLARMYREGFDGSMLTTNDILILTDSAGVVMLGADGRPEGIICNFECVWQHD